MARLNPAPPVISQRRGRWVVDYRDLEGKRKRPSFHTKFEALEFAKEVVKERKEEPEKDAHTLDIKAAIKLYRDSKSAKKAYKDNERRNFFNLVDFLCGKKSLTLLPEITALHLEEYQVFRATQVKPSTVNREFDSYNAFFNWCVKRKLLVESPATVEDLKADKNPRKTWTAKQQERIFSELSEEVRDCLEFMSFTGARNSEATGVKWQDLDFKRGLVTLRCRKGDGTLVERLVPLTKDASAFLKDHREKARRKFQARSEMWVFPNSAGGRMDRCKLSKSVKIVREKLGMPDLKPYGLRHTFGTEIAKINLEAARLALGHSNIRTTQGYLHFDDKYVRSVMERRAGK